MSSSEVISVPKAFFRTEEGMKCLDAIEAWQTQNPDALETDQRLARLEKLTGKGNGKGVGKYAILAVADAGEDGISKADLLAAVNRNGDGKKFDGEALRGWLSLQGIKTPTKPGAPLEEGENGNLILTETGEAKAEKFRKTVKPAKEEEAPSSPANKNKKRQTANA